MAVPAAGFFCCMRGAFRTLRLPACRGWIAGVIQPDEEADGQEADDADQEAAGEQYPGRRPGAQAEQCFLYWNYNSEQTLGSASAKIPVSQPGTPREMFCPLRISGDKHSPDRLYCTDRASLCCKGIPAQPAVFDSAQRNAGLRHCCD